MSARALLDRDGPLSRALAGYEPRPGQLEMAAAVERTIDEDRLLLCEAGTGTGKTLAYLVPALRAGRRVVVSTASRALQEQIARFDLPMALRCVDRDVVTRVVKGLSNYLCLRRFEELRADVDRHRSLTAPLATVERWARGTARGDVAEVSELPEDHPIWRLITSSSDTRVGARCPHFDACHVTRMKREAEQADLLVVNHHLLLADLSVRGDHPGSVLPDYDALIIDEAHKLEDVATLFFGCRLSSSSLERAISDAARSLGLANREAAVPAVASRALEGARSLFAALNLALGDADRAPLASSAWSGRLRDSYHEADDALDQLARHLAERDHPVLDQSAARIERQRHDLATVVDGDAAAITWLERRGEGLVLTTAPVDVGPALRDRLFGRGHAIVLTSASLTTDGGFHYLRGRLGLTELPDTPIDEVVVESSIDHHHQALLYTPSDLPLVDDPRFTERAAERIEALHDQTPGGAFVLCTSVRSMRALAGALERRLARPPKSSWSRPGQRLPRDGTAPEARLWARRLAPGEGVLAAVRARRPKRASSARTCTARRRRRASGHGGPRFVPPPAP